MRLARPNVDDGAHYLLGFGAGAVERGQGGGDDLTDLCGRVFGADQYAIPVQRVARPGAWCGWIRRW